MTQGYRRRRQRTRRHRHALPAARAIQIFAQLHVRAWTGPQTPSSSRKRGPSAWRIEQSGDGRAGDEAQLRTAEIGLDPVPTEFRTPHASKGSVDLSGCFGKPRVTAWLPNWLAATPNRWVPASAGMTVRLHCRFDAKICTAPTRRHRHALPAARANKRTRGLPPNPVPAGPPKPLRHFGLASAYYLNHVPTAAPNPKGTQLRYGITMSQHDIGTDLRLFAEVASQVALRLVDSRVYSNGVLGVTYQPAR